MNEPIVWNLTDQGEGHAILVEISSIWAKGSKRYNICKPRDILMDGKTFFSEDGKRLDKEIIILTESDCRLSFPKGTLSNERDTIVYITPTMEETDPSFKNTKIYQFLKPVIERNRSQKIAIDAMTETLKQTEKLVTELMSLELSDKQLAKTKQIMDIVQPQLMEEKKVTDAMERRP